MEKRQTDVVWKLEGKTIQEVTLDGTRTLASFAVERVNLLDRNRIPTGNYGDGAFTHKQHKGAE